VNINTAAGPGDSARLVHPDQAGGRPGLVRELLARLADPSAWADWTAPAGLVVLLIIFESASHSFLSTGNIQSMLANAAILIVLTVGQTFVILTAGIDLSVASTMTFASIVLGKIITGSMGFVPAIVMCVLAGAAVGLVNGFIVAKGKITDFIVTLGTLSAASALALILSNAQPITVINHTMLRLSTVSFAAVLSYPVLIAAAVALIAHIVLFRTRFGTHVLATGGSADAAAATGIRTTRVKLAVYVISGALAGLAAILYVSQIAAAEPGADTAYLLNSVAAVVLGGVSLFGGRGTILGPVFGALLLTVLTNGLTTLGVSPNYQPLSVGVVVVAAAFLSRFQR
jgi:ribose/xylose/arabinose/galactoside ABC-type transport system permease subunit